MATIFYFHHKLHLSYSNEDLWLCCIVSQDYQEEITVAEENKLQLHQLGERLARASHKSKATEIEQKLNKVSDRWQHLLDLIGAR